MAAKKRAKRAGTESVQYENSTGVYDLANGKLTNSEGELVKASDISSKKDPLKKIGSGDDN